MIIKCKMCGGDIQFNPGDTCGQCDHCGCTTTFPKLPDEQRANLFNRANHFRRQCEFDKAMAAYEHILEVDDTDAEAHWGIVLSKFGIEYVEDPVTHERIPTCHRAQVISILSDEDYQNAIKYAPDTQSRDIYEQEAKRIAEIQKGILAISSQEKPYDVFICYKETDDNGSRTKDSALAQEIYYQLTNEGYKVFFSRITLEDKLGQEYEPYIFAALNSAKVMLVVGTKPENFSAVWVKNEWSRFLAIMKNDRKRVLIPCYRDMDPYDLPEELSSLQSQDMSKIGFMQDLIHGVKKVLGSDKQSTPNVTVQSAGPGVASLHKRAVLFLEDSDWDSATEYFDRILDIDPEYAPAYIGKVQVKNKVRREADLARCRESISTDADYQKALRFADEKQKAIYEGYNRAILERIELERKEDAYREAVALENRAAVEADFLSAARRFDAAGEIRDAKQRAANCRAKAATAKAEAEKAAAVYKEQMERERKERERQEEERRLAEEKRRAEEAERQRREEVLQREKRKRTLKICSVIVAIALLITGGYFVYEKVIHPKIKYDQAQALLNDGKLDEAYAAFNDMLDYGDSATKLLEINYKKAEAFLNEGKLTEAKQYYELAADYSDASQKIKNIDAYTAAETDYQRNDLVSARKRYQALGKFLDASSKLETISGTLYAQAKKALEEKDYERAYSLLTTLGDYSDCSSIIKKVDNEYEAALTLWSNGEKLQAEQSLQFLVGWRNAEEKLVALRIEIADDAAGSEYYDTALSYYAEVPSSGEIEEKIAAAKRGKAYKEAIIELESGNLENAYKGFIAAGAHKDAAQMAEKVALYQNAAADKKTADYEAARSIYQNLGDFLDANIKLESCNTILYERATQKLNAGDVAEAVRIYSLLGDYSDSEDIKAGIEMQYNTAISLMENGKYEEALNAFEELKNYTDCQVKATESRYQWAKVLTAEKQFESAIKLFEELGDYNDSVQQIQAARYDKAKELWASGDLKGTLSELKILGDYRDAKELLKSLSIEIAEKATADKDYATALDVYLHMEQTDEIKVREYMLAQTCYNEGCFAEATEAYEGLGQYELSLSRLPIARYAWAEQLFKDGEFEKAAKQFDLLGDMTDSAERAKESRYQFAEQNLNNSEYEAAKGIYAELAGYKDAETKACECDYQTAANLLNQGDVESAKVIFTSLGEYADSASKVDQCIYVQAGKRFDAGDYAAAYDLYQSVNYQDSQEKAKESAYLKASELYEAKQYAEAEKIFLAIDGYSDSEDRAKDSHLQQGNVLMEQGNYQEALNYFETVDSADSKALAAKCHYELGRAAHISGNMDEAVRQYAYALTVHEAREALMLSAKDYASINETKKMIQILWLIREEPEAIDMLMEIGQMKARVGQEGTALTAYFVTGCENLAEITELIEKESVEKYESEIEEYDLLPENLQFINFLRYRYAIAVREAGAYDAAVEMFEKAINYSDTETQIQETRFQQAQKFYEDGYYSSAYQTYQKISGYKDVDSLIANDDNLAAIASAAAREAKLRPYKTVGSYVEFGAYPQGRQGTDQTAIEWLVLAYDATRNKALLLSRYGLDAKPYKSDCSNTTWERSTIRKWLNEEFLKAAFSAEEQAAILMTAVDNSSSQGSHSKNGNIGGNNTRDQIFLLSYAEANRYLGVNYGSNPRCCVSPTAYAISHGTNTSLSKKTKDGTVAWRWWLRSHGTFQDTAEYVNNDGSLSFATVDAEYAVRPAFWLNLDSDIF